MSGGFHRKVVCSAIVALPALGALVVPTSANALAKPGALHTRVTAVTSSSFTVQAHARHAASYRLFADTNRRHLFVRNIGSAEKSKKAKSALTVRGLHYTTAPYYYRVEAMNGRRTAWSGIGSVGLRPAAPTNVQATSGSTGTFLTWTSHGATGSLVSQATDPGMTQNLHTYTIRSADEQFSPYGLGRGTTYYFRVRSLNAATPSPYSSTVSTTVVTAQQPVRVMTYNVKLSDLDGKTEGGQKVAPWSKRVVGAVQLIKQGDPDVLALQEAGGWIAQPRGKRQVDDINDRLGSYSLANTEIPPSQPHYHRYGIYILYKTSVYQAVGNGGVFALGNSRWAAYQILKNRSTGASFLMVTPHLAVIGGVKGDKQRRSETENLLQAAGNYASAHRVPVLYAGDFNSHPFHKPDFDGPGQVMSAHHVADGFTVAQSRKHARYNSANGYLRKPPKFGDSIDHVYAPPGVAIRSWQLILDLHHGRYVGVMPSDHNPLVSDVLFPY